MINNNFQGHWVRSRDITSDDTAGTVGAIDVPANTWVDKVVVKITDTFSTGGYVSVGDGDDPDGWLTSTGARISDGTLALRTGTGGAFVYGKGYLTADQIDVYLVESTEGSLFVSAHLVPMADLL